jgi:hypothetical protein
VLEQKSNWILTRNNGASTESTQTNNDILSGFILIVVEIK